MNKTLIVFGTFIFDGKTAHIQDIEETLLVPANETTAHRIAEDMIEKGMFDSYIIPCYYDGEIIWK